MRNFLARHIGAVLLMAVAMIITAFPSFGWHGLLLLALQLPVLVGIWGCGRMAGRAHWRS